MEAKEKLKRLKEAIECLERLNNVHDFEADDDYPYPQVEEAANELWDYAERVAKKAGVSE